MAVLTLPGWLDWSAKGRAERKRREREAPVQINRKRRASMGTRKREEVGSSSLPGLGQSLVVVAWTVVVGLALLMAVAIMGWMTSRPLFQISRAVVVGDLQQADRELIEKRARTLRGNFFTLNLATAASELRTLPWVRSVNLRRLWPNGLEVNVEEHHAFAHWGDDALLNTYGEVFNADYTGSPLPRYDGPAGTGPLMMQEVQEFNRQLAPLKLSVQAVSLSERRSWVLRLSDGLTVTLGRDNVHERLAQFVSVFPHLFSEAVPDGMSADLRYAHGFALFNPEARR